MSDKHIMLDDFEDEITVEKEDGGLTITFKENGVSHNAVMCMNPKRVRKFRKLLRRVLEQE